MEATSHQPQMIETHGLRRVFKARKRVVEAVAGVDLTVTSGEIFGFLGPNGAGKTTTLRMLTTLLPPSGGTAKVSGFDLLRQQARVRERIGYVGQAGGADREIIDRGEVAMPNVLRLLDGAGLQLQTMGLHRPSLDDVFLRQTGRSLRETAA